MATKALRMKDELLDDENKIVNEEKVFSYLTFCSLVISLASIGYLVALAAIYVAKNEPLPEAPIPVVKAFVFSYPIGALFLIISYVRKENSGIIKTISVVIFLVLLVVIISFVVSSVFPGFRLFNN